MSHCVLSVKPASPGRKCPIKDRLVDECKGSTLLQQGHYLFCKQLPRQDVFWVIDVVLVESHQPIRKPKIVQSFTYRLGAQIDLENSLELPFDRGDRHRFICLHHDLVYGLVFFCSQ